MEVQAVTGWKKMCLPTGRTWLAGCKLPHPGYRVYLYFYGKCSSILLPCMHSSNSR